MQNVFVTGKHFYNFYLSNKMQQHSASQQPAVSMPAQAIVVADNNNRFSATALTQMRG